ncbi:MAG: Sjogren's syndrome/scleroderma autoantigen 1 family protein [Candidatus Bathyarchaeia archaeon]
MGIEVKRMAELLKSGASMLQETCPQCGTPLFRRGTETFCAKCNRPVVIIRNAEDETRLMTNQILDGTEQTLLTKIQQVNVALKTETDPSRLLTYGSALKTWLEAIDNLRRLKVRD